MTSHRPHDWPERLHAFISAHRKSAFAWGSVDCCRFAFGAIAAHTGKPVLGVPDWTDLATAIKAMKSLGPDLAAFATAIAVANGWPELRVAYAQRGDLVAVPCEPRMEVFGASMAICEGERAITMGEQGLTSVPIRFALRAWRV